MLTMVTTDNVLVFTFVLMRMSGCILFNPIIGRRSLPNLYKAALIMTLTLLVVAYTNPVLPEIDSTIELFIKLMAEFFVGFTIGFIINLFILVISFGGEVIDYQMGLSMAKIFDPASNINMSLSASFFNILFTLLFFISNGHLTMIRIFMETERLVPYGQVVLPFNVSGTVMNIFFQCTVMAVKLALPIIVVEFLVEMGVGIIMKAIPQINIFVINIQLKVVMGLLMLVFMFGPFAAFIENLMNTMFEAINAAVATLG